MEDDQNDINSCDSNANGDDGKAISRDSKTSSGDSNASGSDSNAIGGDNNASGSDSHTSGGDNNECNHDRNCQTVDKAKNGSSSQGHSDGRGDEGASKSSEKSFNWQLQLNGRYDD